MSAFLSHRVVIPAPKILLRASFFVVTSAFLAMMATSTSAQTLTVLHSFTSGADGASPNAALVMDSAGNLFGTTYTGGRYKYGTIFKIDTAGETTILHQFTYPQGANSLSPLFLDAAGDLYGANFLLGETGRGTAFELRAGGKFIVLHTFGGLGTFDGQFPYGAFTRDANGELFGTTTLGGTYLQGAVYKLDHRTGVETVLYNFAGLPDGANPNGSLRMDADGNLYGTTGTGGLYNTGAVFKVDPSGVETVLYSFGTSSPSDGITPSSGLVRDREGNFYGVTALGGTFDLGTLFKLETSGAETILHNFDGSAEYPICDLAQDAAGNIYGTTVDGGTYGAGTVFEFDPQGNFRILHSFTGLDGAGPRSGVILDGAGNLYGTTTSGGAYGWGVAYKLAPSVSDSRTHSQNVDQVTSSIIGHDKDRSSGPRPLQAF